MQPFLLLCTVNRETDVYSHALGFYPQENISTITCQADNVLQGCGRRNLKSIGIYHKHSSNSFIRTNSVWYYYVQDFIFSAYNSWLK
jgi:hypothetical protein